LGVIKAANPDILGIQEASDWDKGAPPIAQQVAAELGLPHYFLGRSKSGLPVAVFSKFEIVAAENLSDQVGNVAALRAQLAGPGGAPIHVFVVHLDPFSPATRAAEVTTLNQVMAPHLQAATILMGDTNIACVETPEDCEAYRLLAEAGWRLVMKERYVINQIWTSPLLARSVQEMKFPEATFAISDHLPVGAILEVHPTP